MQELFLEHPFKSIIILLALWLIFLIIVFFNQLSFFRSMTNLPAPAAPAPSTLATICPALTPAPAPALEPDMVLPAAIQSTEFIGVLSFFAIFLIIIAMLMV